MANSSDIGQIMQEYTAMGFEPQDIIIAWLRSNQRQSLLLDALFAINKEKGKSNNISVAAKPNGLTQSQALIEEQTRMAIKLSLEDKDKYNKPDQYIRRNGKPVGLKNVGNTCYFNSLIQTIFQIKELLHNILSYSAPVDVDKTLLEAGVTDSVAIKRKKACIKLVLALRRLFVMMIFGNKNIVDPSDMTRHLVDAQGNPMKIGEQLDIGEFAINLFERLEEGLSLNDQPDGEQVEKPTSFKDLFFGVSKDFISFVWAGIRTKKDQDAIFGPINLSINQKDLMSSLDAFINYSVEGYQTPNGEMTTAQRNIWITKPPKVLTFTLQRSVYDREKGLMKTNDPFEFPKELFLDRFLLSNKKLLKNMAEEKISMRTRLRKIDTEIAKMQEFGKTKANLLTALETAAEFLEEQAEEVNEDFVEVNSDASDDKLENCGELKELRRSAEILKKYKEKISQRIEVLEKRRQSLKIKLENSFKDFQNKKYRLHSVVVHEGGINGGHYYTFTYNARSKKWLKFNDSIVDEVSEQEVYKLARGGETGVSSSEKSKPKNPCAYSLFYVEDTCEVIDFTPECTESLKKFLSKDLLNLAEIENEKFLIECQHYNTNMVKKIYDEYILKMNTINLETSKFQKDLKSKIFPFAPSIPNFASFLSLEVSRCSEIARWSVLKSIISSKKVPFDVLRGEQRNHYYYGLKDLIVDKSFAYTLKSLELSENDQKLLIEKKKEYLVLKKCTVIIDNIFTLIRAKKWKETMATINVLHDTLGQVKMNEYTNQFYSFSSYLLAIMSLKYCSLIDMYQRRSDTKEALKLLEIMIYCLNRKESVKPPEIFYQQITANLYNTINVVGKTNMEEADIIIFMHHIQKIEEKCEFLPSQDLSQLVNPNLRRILTTLEADTSLYENLEIKADRVLEDGFNSAVKNTLKVWSEFEDSIRKKNILLDQNVRETKERLTWTE